MIEEEFIQLAKEALEKKKGDLLSRLPEGSTEYPDYGEDEEANVTEVEDYGTKLDVDNNLFKELKATEEALERIRLKNYGLCLKCEKPIDRRRLEAYPAAKLCLDCGKK